MRYYVYFETYYAHGYRFDIMDKGKCIFLSPFYPSVANAKQDACKVFSILKQGKGLDRLLVCMIP